YSLGLSYASKDSPPFIHPQAGPKKAGFAGQNNKIGRWVEEMLSLRAGRGELEVGEGGWGEGNGEESKKWGAGEDFFTIVEGSGNTHLAVADGVGGWAPQYDPSLFSQSLLYHYTLSSRSSPSSSPSSHLTSAYQAVLSDPLVQAGSSTAVTISLSPTGFLSGLNLGDSGCTILRSSKPLHTTIPQTHAFNTPYQLSKFPPKPKLSSSERSSIIEQLRALKKGEMISPELEEKAQGLMPDPISTKPNEGDEFKSDLQPGDTVLIYTDGMSDNLPFEHLPLLEQVVERVLDQPVNAHLTPGERASEKARILADVLVGYARGGMMRTGLEEGWKTPFELEAKKYSKRFLGGKVDDITVLTAVVTE
ncbi:hypothetical protein TREMEDRAFT_16396, partial [Tremella mesenterica DSM 1558]|uniref:uncharacterized protein n=1 Tax=Tremella mesenterica (strain ATCC 24925 / CBS 8224 / DSM 1558 / NBRC 9311 / NRRL Y-6157 / RJB 2259-6 / UBC 559-6) TaxID=578456 RepID=UPI0003F4A3B7